VIPVVINADDFGLTEGVCAGIVKTIHAGGVTATTAMVCVPEAADRLKRWAPKIPGRVGLHFQLTSGAPVLPPERVPSLVQQGGQFPAIRKQVRAPRTEEILAEWRAQIELLLRTGIEPTHLDSHHHIHRLPLAFPAFCELAKQYGLPARALDTEMTGTLRAAGVPCVDRTLTGWYAGELSVHSLISVLREGARESPGAASFEVMCHPGFVDDDLPPLSRYLDDREKELTALCDGALQQELAADGFALSPIAFAAGFTG
jgi:chitin disaccharide deacetylase